jgi:FkbM family methyltransferase
MMVEAVFMNTLTVKLRSIARKMKLNRLVYRFRTTLQPTRGYEEPFSRALENSVKARDVVWDIGANVGIYTELFCRWVGPEGHVVGFEPNPGPIAQIKERLQDCSWLTLENVALGARNELSTLIVEKGYTPSGHVGHGSETKDPGKSVIPIRMTTGDQVCERLGRVPNVMKIDVEGFEEEVLLGLDHTLLSPVLRAVLVEVHFSALESRGQATAPVRIEKFLKTKGFRVRWVDSGHILADRSV